MEIPASSATTPAAEVKPTTSTPSKPPIRSSLLSDSRSKQIATPEKPVESLRRSAKRSVAFSVSQVKSVALGLRSSVKARHEEDGCGSETVSTPVEVRPIDGSGGKRPGADSSNKLPEEYEKLGELFGSMVTSMRLMRLKGQMCTFSNICPKVEYLTDRRFSHAHLAQMKYILSEALVLKKVLSHNEATSCMKPDIQIFLLPDALGSGTKQKEGNYSTLNKIFRARLVEYFKEHPGGDEIPEAALPEPFCCAKVNEPLVFAEDPNPNSASLPLPKSSDIAELPSMVAPSHMPQSFRSRFSQKASSMLPKPKEVAKETSKMESTIASPVKFGFNSPDGKRSFSLSDRKMPFVGSSKFPGKGDEEQTDCDGSVTQSGAALDGTPSRVVSTPAKLMTATPELQTPKRFRPIAEDSTAPTKKSAKRHLSLDKHDELDDVPSSLRFLPKSLLQSVKENERKAMEDKEMNLSNAKKRQQMISCLPKLFDMIHLIFQSSKQSVITRQQLIYKIVVGHLDIVDRCEIEEQLNLLQELVPDWISARTISTGDFVYSVNKAMTAESVRQILSEAKQDKMPC